ncbi:MAG TPA: serine/threonine-protein kinase, partial [Polyangiaceae bacterium]|nr:serine/threonine-protein kinase [Polyangiaceae bacterium]
MHTDPSLDTECTPLKLAGYEPLSELSQRGVVNVYLARRSAALSAGELVVVKRARPEIVLEAQFAEAFVSASRAALCLEHPNIVRTQAVAAEDSDYHVVEEFVDGKSLHRLWRSDTAPPLPRELHVWILTQVLSGLHYAHERVQCSFELPRGFVHQLVNPSSVLVSYGGEVKLADFGLGAFFGATLAAPAERATRQLAYAAPEQCLGAPVDHRADVFAVGMMLWEALTGRQRWNGHSDAEMFLERVQGEEPPIAPLAPTAPPALVAICERALAHDPKERFQSALEFSQALHLYLQTIGWVGGAQKLSLLTRGQIEGTSDYPAR